MSFRLLPKSVTLNDLEWRNNGVNAVAEFLFKEPNFTLRRLFAWAEER